MTLQILSFLSFAIGVFCFSIKELSAHGKLKWAKETIGGDLPTFWAQHSDMRKYKIDKSNPRAYSFAKAPDNWYYRFFKIKHKEKWFTSTNFTVMFTDGMHLCQALFFLFISLAFSIALQLENWKQYLLVYIGIHLVHFLTYRLLQK